MDEIFCYILLDCIYLLENCRYLQYRFEFVAVVGSRLVVRWLQACHNERNCDDLSLIGAYLVDCLWHELMLMRSLRLFG